MTAQTISTQTTGAATTTVVRELPADLETPVSIYLKLAGAGPSFLLESVTGGEHVARYSFIGVDPAQAYVLRGRQIETRHLRAVGQPVSHKQIDPDQDPMDALRQIMAQFCQAPSPELPRFSGGLVGYLGYEMMRYFEPSLEMDPHAELPDAIFLLADVLVAFDHAFGRVLLIGNACQDNGSRPSQAQIEARLDEIERRLAAPLPHSNNGVVHTSKDTRSNMSQAQFCQAVETAKEHIAAGDIFQVVLSQRLQRQTDAQPFEIYRAMRRLNPSPYMFYFDFANIGSILSDGNLRTGATPLRLIGASPEMHVRLEDQIASVRPIAGTRPRGKTAAREIELEKELLADPKERAEHVMLVDLARNDLGRICEYGSVQVTEQMVIERYSHVIHLVSHVEGRLRPELDAFDLLRATFPAGTVSGAPKIRAMQIINNLEHEPRGPYAGAVGYFSFDGSMDTCIAIRTMVMQGSTVSLQAGAGIVADSIPENEYQETLNKLRALAVAIDIAEGRTASSPTRLLP